jgi:hypothetical protein
MDRRGAVALAAELESMDLSRIRDKGAREAIVRRVWPRTVRLGRPG